MLNNKEEQNIFNNKLKKMLSKSYNIPENEIIITNPQKGSYMVQVIFESNEFNNINFDINSFKGKLNDGEFAELKGLKEIQSSLIMEGIKLSPSMLDERGNRISGWGENEKRGGFNYIPPKGWKGFGLKVWGKYDNGNNAWLASDGNPQEWAIAYHGIGAGGSCKTVEDAAKNIYLGGFKSGNGQFHKEAKNINDRYIPKDANNNYSEFVGIGVYCSPEPNVMDGYAKTSTKQVNGKKYKIGFMMRVRPDKIRISQRTPSYWVLDGTTDETRPYRIMLKENK